jgi:hypothetical protein
VRRSLGHSSSLGTPRSFNPLGGSDARCPSRLSKRLLPRGICLQTRRRHCRRLCLPRRSICHRCGRLCFGLRLQLLLPHLLRRAMPQLRPVFTARRRKIAILCAMQVRPRIENRYILGCICNGQLIDPVYAAGVHNFVL